MNKLLSADSNIKAFFVVGAFFIAASESNAVFEKPSLINAIIANKIKTPNSNLRQAFADFKNRKNIKIHNDIDSLFKSLDS